MYVDPDGKFLWVVAAVVIVSMMTTPSVANAPAPGGATYQSPSTAAVVANGVVAGASMGVGSAVSRGAAGLGAGPKLAGTAGGVVGGAAAGTGMQATADVDGGVVSDAQAYVHSAAVGAMVGGLGGFIAGALVKGAPKTNELGPLHKEAIAARDSLAAELATGKHPPATVTAGYSPASGRVAAGASQGGGKGCAETVCAGKLGNPPDMKFTPAVRPRTGQQVPVCDSCEGTFGRGAFPDPRTI